MRLRVNVKHGQQTVIGMVAPRGVKPRNVTKSVYGARAAFRN
jgi:hypothetical protein